MAELALLALMRGDDEGAQLWLGRAARLKPDWAQTQYAYGLLYNRQGKYEQAIGCLEKAVQLALKHLQAQYQLSVAYLRTGNEAKAAEHREIYEQLIEAQKLKSLSEDARGK